tara:strand:+ start:76 stop:738 length:663 start_codon:yes stop_codon:yes gene_type:complete
MPPRRAAAKKSAATKEEKPAPEVAEVGEKREREEEEEEPKEDEKKAKVGSNGGDGAEDASTKEEEEEEEEKKEDGTPAKTTWTPVKLGPKTFESPEDAIKYLSWLLNTVTMKQDLNDYERMVVEAMLKQGHESAEKKIGESGIKSIQVNWHLEHDSKCYYVVRNDGSISDFSYRKCVEGCFPGWDKSNASKSEHRSDRGRHGGRGDGRKHHGGGGGYRRY